MKTLQVLITAGALVLCLPQGSSPDAGQQGSSQQQSTQPNRVPSSPEVNRKSTVTGVEGGTAVITVRRPCGESEGKRDVDCSRVITREEFEIVMKTLAPGQSLAPETRRNLAKTYAELLAFEDAADRAGLDKTPEFQRLMKLVRVRTMADLYRQKLQEDFRNSSPEEIDAYYQQHLSDFEQVKLQRILIPRTDSSAPNKADFEQKALQAATAAHDRAARGQDLAQIQRDAYTALGLASPPLTEMGNHGRGDFLENEASEIFELQPGRVSQIEFEPTSYVIYRVVERKTLPQGEVKDKISRIIAGQKFQSAIKRVTDSAHAELNEQYFGTDH